LILADDDLEHEAFGCHGHGIGLRGGGDCGLVSRIGGGLSVLGPEAHLIGLRIDLCDADAVLPRRLLRGLQGLRERLDALADAIDLRLDEFFGGARGRACDDSEADGECSDDCARLLHAESPLTEPANVPVPTCKGSTKRTRLA
jgi:hypothetical protein